MDEQTRKLMFSSNNPDYETPDDLAEEWIKKYEITHDVCADKNNTKCLSFWGIEDDCLSQEWSGRNWMNPPYNKPEKKCIEPWSKCEKKGCEKRGFHLAENLPGQYHFVKKAYEEALIYFRATTVVLLPACSLTRSTSPGLRSSQGRFRR